MVGKEILGYHVDEKIGSGGFGTVYKVSKTNAAGTYIRALKHITLPTKKQYASVLNSMGGDYAKADDYFASALNDIVNEIKILSTLSEGGVNNIVRYYENDIIETSSPKTYDIYILMEYLTPFTDYVDNRNFTVKDIIKVGKDILSALVSCHEKNIIHRDIKDDNIFVTADGVYKLGDFGVSKALKDKSRAESVKGTPNFIAPEVYLGKEKYDNTVDVYSLGIVMYKLLNKMRNPFLPTFPAPYNTTDEDAAFEARMTCRIPELPVSAQNKLGQVILKSIMPREQRYNSAKEFLSALESVEAEMSEVELSTIAVSGIADFNMPKQTESLQQPTKAVSNETIVAGYTVEAEEPSSEEDRHLFDTFSVAPQPKPVENHYAPQNPVFNQTTAYVPQQTPPTPSTYANNSFSEPEDTESSNLRLILYSIASAIGLVLFNLIAFVIPGKIGVTNVKFDGAFWTGYLFITLAFIGQFVCAYLVLKNVNIKKLFYKIPVLAISYSGLIAMLVSGSIFMLVSGIAAWIGVCICAIVLVIYATATIKALLAADVIAETDTKVKISTFAIKSLVIDSQSIMESAKSEELRKEAKKVYEAIRYSDPMSNAALYTLENQIRYAFSEFEIAIKSEEVELAAKLGEDVIALVNKRNQKCKLLK